MTDEVLLSIHDLRVQYGNFLAVDGLSLELAGGQLLGLVGPNGAGKTTTLRAAAGLQPISTGSVRVMGWDVFKEPTLVGQHLGFTPDTPAVYQGLTVEQFLDFIGQCYGLTPTDRAERGDHWLELLWLKDKRTAKIQTLSRGMRQRLAVARTLLSDPHVVLLDEPAAGLDPAGRVQFRQLLASLRDQGKAIIVSSHILADLADYCTHIAIMEHGRLLKYGTVAQVAGAAGHERCNYQVTLARSVGDAAQRLAGLEGVTQLQLDGSRLTLEFDRDRAAAAGLLRQLLAVGLPVAEFRALEPDLEQAYLRSGIEQVD
ncbi:MAG: ABC transporter ATP-binding protein [Phycisphaerae bacterium]|nr:ABC transporter ATP-binding protein [Phycisphaerae bacterium]